MNYAMDAQNNRINILNAEYSQEYFCPVCNGTVIQKKGEVNAWHFAHLNSCDCDDWYQTSEWHLEWQDRFPEKYREVVIDDGYEKHRADVKVDELIVEFQNSPISGYDFECRNDFYTDCGMLVWVFNLQDKYIYERHPSKQGKTTQYQWNWAYKFNDLDSYGCEFDLFFQIETDLLIKVKWNKQGFKYFGGYKYTKAQFMNFLRRRYKRCIDERLDEE